jgi:hypothetical protein
MVLLAGLPAGGNPVQLLVQAIIFDVTGRRRGDRMYGKEKGISWN